MNRDQGKHFKNIYQSIFFYQKTHISFHNKANSLSHIHIHIFKQLSTLKKIMSVLLYRRDVLEFGAFGQLTLKWLIQDYPVNNKTKTKKFFLNPVINISGWNCPQINLLSFLNLKARDVKRGYVS